MGSEKAPDWHVTVEERARRDWLERARARNESDKVPDQSVVDAIQILENAGWSTTRLSARAGQPGAVTPPRREPPPELCVICGADEEANDNLPLTDVTVIVADGEEGHSSVRRFYCEEHLDDAVEALMGIGLKQHRHGGICFLEDETCPGHTDMCACPIPEDYDGNIIVDLSDA